MNRRYLFAVVALIAIAAVLANVGSLTAASKKAKDPSIAWTADLNKAIAQATKQGKPLMVDFYADWCGPCKKLGSETFTNDRVVELSKKFVCVRLNVDNNKALAKQYKVEGIPNVVFLNSKGKEITRSVGFRNADDFLKVMQSALNKAK